MKINLQIESEDESEIKKLFAALAGVETRIVRSGDKELTVIKPAKEVRDYRKEIEDDHKPDRDDAEEANIKPK